MTKRLGIIAILGLVASGFGIAPAGAVHLSCGDIVLTDTVLDSDIGPCPNGGLFVGADGITLDLNGFRVFGTPGTPDGAGIYVFRRTGVIVKNGTVTDFDGGVVIEGGTRNMVSGIHALNNISAPSTTTAGTTRWGDGIAVLSSTNNRIVANEAANNGPFSGIGVYSNVDNDHPRQTTGVSTGNVISANSIHDNITTRAGVVNFAATEADGVRLEPGSVGNFVTANQIARNGLDGVAVFSGNSTDNVIRNNEIFGNGRRTGARRGDGIRVFATANRTIIEYNKVHDNGGNGIIVGSQSNTIRYNEVLNNGRLPPLNPANANTFTFDLNDQNANCDANVWFGNVYRTTRLACSATGGTQV